MNEKKNAKAIHSVHNMNYHLVLVTKYRREVIDGQISADLQGIFERIGKSHDIKLVEWDHDQDHIHALYKAAPTTHQAKFVNAYKSASSRLIKRDYPGIKKQLWKEFFWSRSYYIATCGGVTIDMIEDYIKDQGEN